jgi:hypothetical protein
MKLLYTLSTSLYINLTSQQHGLSLIASRGPSFQMPLTSGFEYLCREPSVDEIIDALSIQLRSSSSSSSSPSSAPSEIVFSGSGEPFLHPSKIIKVSHHIKSILPYLPIRVTTSGLASVSSDSLKAVKESGVDSISVHVLTVDSDASDELHGVPNSFRSVTGFIEDAKRVGFDVRGSTVERGGEGGDKRGEDVGSVREYFEGLNVNDFKVRSYHP